MKKWLLHFFLHEKSGLLHFFCFFWFFYKVLLFSHLYHLTPCNCLFVSYESLKFSSSFSPSSKSGCRIVPPEPVNSIFVRRRIGGGLMLSISNSSELELELRNNAAGILYVRASLGLSRVGRDSWPHTSRTTGCYTQPWSFHHRLTAGEVPWFRLFLASNQCTNIRRMVLTRFLACNEVNTLNSSTTNYLNTSFTSRHVILWRVRECR